MESHRQFNEALTPSKYLSQAVKLWMEMVKRNETKRRNKQNRKPHPKLDITDWPCICLLRTINWLSGVHNTSKKNTDTTFDTCLQKILSMLVLQPESRFQIPLCTILVKKDLTSTWCILLWLSCQICWIYSWQWNITHAPKNWWYFVQMYICWWIRVLRIHCFADYRH